MLDKFIQIFIYISIYFKMFIRMVQAYKDTQTQEEN